MLKESLIQADLIVISICGEDFGLVWCPTALKKGDTGEKSLVNFDPD